MCEILIVDDITINRLLIKESIKLIPNLQIKEMGNGQECIDGITNNTKIILMDVMMPVMDGITATKIIKNNFPNIIIIGITGQIPIPEHSLFDHILYKPYRTSVLIDLIQNIHGK